ncbi:tetratricopeptide repeat protein [Rubritalea sp.]|uniref:tetratricopeptide repeat protein n=1 Tax=Rubritalea sp. TaxID=2109375 RepID=UPI003EF3FD49
MKMRLTTLAFAMSLGLASLHASPEPSAKVLKYHKALQSRPLNQQLFERFYSTWLEEQNLDALGSFLSNGDEKNWQHWALLSRYQMRRGLNEEAITSLGNAIAQAPSNEEMLLMRAKLYIRNLEFPKAINDLEQIKPTDNEQSIEATRLLGSAYIRVNEVEKALELWSKAIKLSSAGIDFVDAAATEGEFAKAAELCAELIDITKQPYEKVRYRIRLAELQSAGEKHKEALATLTTTLKDTGNDSWLEEDILRKADSIFDRKGDLPGQIDFYKKLYSEHPYRSNIKSSYAFLLASSDQWGEANKLFKELLQSSPDNHDLRQDYILLLTSADKNQEALEELDLILKQKGNSDNLLLQRIALLKKLERTDEVLSVLELIANAAEETETDQIRIAHLYLQNDLKDQAEEILKAAAAPVDALTAKEALAGYYLTENKTQLAVETLKQALPAADIESLIRLTSSLSNAGEPELAYDSLLESKEAFASDARYLTALCNLAVSAQQEEDSLDYGLDLLHLAERSQELESAIRINLKLIRRSELEDQTIKQLEALEAPSSQDLCLLATLYAIEDIDRANKFLTEQNTTEDVLITSYLATLLIQHKRTDEATEILAKLVETADGRNGSFLRKLAQLQRSTGRTDEALATVQLWKEISPNDKIAWIWESELLAKNGDLPKAISTLRRASTRFEQASDLQTLLSKNYLSAGMYQDAYDVLWKAFENAPSVESKLDWSKQLVRLSGDLAQLSELKSTFLQRKAGNPKSIAPIVALIQIADYENDLDTKKEYTLEALRLQPKSENLLYSLAEIEEQLGNLVKAESYHTQAYEITHSQQAHSKLMRFYFRTGQENKAVALLQQDLNKTDLRELETTARELYMLGYLEAAISSIESAATANPDDWRLNYLHAILLEDAGYTEKATQKFITLLNASGVVDGFDRNQNNLIQSSQPTPINDFRNSFYKAYIHRQQIANLSRRSNPKIEDTIALPDSAESTQSLASVHLLNLAGYLNEGAELEAIYRALDATDFKDPHIAVELTLLSNLYSDSRRNRGTFFLKPLLEKYPQSEFLFLVNPHFASTLEPSKAAAAATYFTDSPSISVQAASSLLSDKSDQDQFDLGLKIIRSFINTSSDEEHSYLFDPILSKLCIALLHAQHHLTDERQQQLQTLAQEIFDRSLHEPNREHFHSLCGSLSYFAVIGDHERMLSLFNHPKVIEQLNDNKTFSHKRTGNDHGYLLYNVKNALDYAIKLQLQYRNIAISQNESSTKKEIENIKKIEASLRHIVENVESEILAFKIHCELEQYDQARAILVKARENNAIDDFTALAFLISLERAEGNFDKAANDAIELGKKATDPYSITFADACLLLTVGEITSGDTSKYTLQITQALTRFKSSKENYVQHHVAELVKRFDVKLPQTRLVNRDVAQKREQKLRSIIGVPLEEQYKRVASIAESGNKESAARLAIRLLLQRLEIQNDSSNGLEELVTCIQTHQLEELIFDTLKVNAESSALRNSQYVTVLKILGHHTEAIEVIKSLEDARSPEAYNTLQIAHATYRDDPKEALNLLQSIDPDQLAFSFSHTPSVANLDVDSWIEWWTLIADFSLTLEKKENTSMHWLIPMASQCNSYKRFGNSIYFYDIFSRQHDAKEQQARRTEAGVKLAKAMMRFPETASYGFKMLTLLKENKIITEQPDENWLHQFIQSGALSYEDTNPSSASRHSDNFSNQYNRNGLGISFAAVLCKSLKKNGADSVLPKSFLSQLSDSKLKNCLQTLINLNNAKGVQFESLLKETQEKWSEGNPIYQDLAQNLETLKPYTVQQLNEALEEILPELGKFAQLDYQKQRNLFNQLSQIFQSTLDDLSRKEAVTLYKNIAEHILGDRDQWKYHKGQEHGYAPYVSLNKIASMMSQNPRLALVMAQASWEFNIPYIHGTYYATNDIRRDAYKSVEERIAALDDLGLLNELEDFYPITVQRVSSENIFNAQRLESGLTDLANQFSHKEEWQLVAEKLLERENQTFGSLLTAALLMKEVEQKKATVLKAFESHSSELHTLTESQLLALDVTLAKYLPSGAESTNANLDKFTLRLEKLANQKRLTQAKALSEQLLSGSAFKSSNNHYQLINSIADYSAHLYANHPEEAFTLLKEFHSAFQKQLKEGGTYTRNNSSNYAVKSLYEDALNDIFFKLKELNEFKESRATIFAFVTDINNDPSLETHTHWANDVLRDLERLVDADAKTLNENNKLPRHEIITALVEKYSALPERLHPIASAALLLSMLDDSDWSIELDDPILLSWQNKAAESVLYRAAYLAAQFKVKDEDEEQAKRSLTSIKLVLEDKQIPVACRLELIAEAIYRNKYLIGQDAFNLTVLEVQKELLNTHRSAQTSIQETLLERYASRINDFPDAKTTVNAIFRTWLDAAKKPLKGEKLAIYQRLANHAITLALRTDDLDSMKWLLANSSHDLQGEIPILIELIRMEQFTQARRLLPLPGKLYREWSSKAYYDEGLEEQLAAFKEFLNKPTTFYRLECELLHCDADNQNYNSSESVFARTERLSKQFDSIKLNKSVKIEALAALCLSHTGRTINADHIASILEGRSFLTTFKEYSKNSSNRELEWLLDFFIYRASTAIALGDYAPLEEIVTSLEKTAQDSNLSYRTRTYQAKLGTYTGDATVMAVQNHSDEQLEVYLKLLKRLALNAHRNKLTDNKCKTTPLAYAKLVSSKLGKRAEMDDWATQAKLLPDAQKTFTESMKLANILVYYAWNVDYDDYWLHPDNKEHRLSLFTWLLSNQEVAESMLANRYWAAKYLRNNGLTEDEVSALTGTIEVNADLNKALLTYRATLYSQKKEYDKALTDFNAAIDLMQDQDSRWDSYYDDAVLNAAEIYLKTKRIEKAREYAKYFRTKDTRKNNINRRKKLHKALKNKNP